MALIHQSVDISWDRLELTNGWTNEQQGNVLFVTMPARDGEQYRIRVDCSGPSNQPPSILFVNHENSSNDPKAWPRGNPSFHSTVKPPPSCFLCAPYTREGVNHHAEWRDYWSQRGYGLKEVLNRLHQLLHSDDYLGRGV